MRLAIILATVVLVSGVVWTFYSQRGETADDGKVDPITQTHTTETRIIRRQSGELFKQKLQLAGLQQDVAELKSRDDEPPRAVEGPPLEVPMEEALANARAEKKARADNLDRLLKNDPVDRGWADAVEEKARTWASEENRAELTSLVCGSKFCRAEILPKDPADRRGVLDNATLTPPFNTNGYVYTPDPEGGASVIYFTKDGYAMNDITGEGESQK